MTLPKSQWYSMSQDLLNNTMIFSRHRVTMTRSWLRCIDILRVSDKTSYINTILILNARINLINC